MARHTIQEYLGLPASWPVIENIKHEIVLMPNAADIKNARPKDPRGCALHNAACRVFDVPNAAIGGRWAYIPQRDAKGKPYIARLQAPAETQRAIRHFDRTNKMPEGGFRFIPIPRAARYKNKRAYMRFWDAGKVGHTGRINTKPKRRLRTTNRAIPRSLTP